MNEIIREGAERVGGELAKRVSSPPGAAWCHASTTKSQVITPPRLPAKPIGEWHLLCTLGVPMLRDFPASLGTRNLQPRIGLRSPLSLSWLDASGPLADLACGDQRE